MHGRTKRLWKATSSSDYFPLVPTPTPNTTLPGTPTGVTGSPGDRSVGLVWTAPSNGGSPITNYRITPYIGTTAQAAVLTGSGATSYTVTGLTNGTTYTFTVAAINSVGTGPASAQSPTVTPGTGYTNVIFADGFESGSLANWNGTLGNGSASAVGAAAHTGNYGLRLSNASGQFQVLVKALPTPLVDSSVSFWGSLPTTFEIRCRPCTRTWGS